MNLHYFRDPVGNFGDDLNPWLWPQLIPDFFNTDVTNPDAENVFVGIGTLLNEQLPLKPKKIIFGSGVGYGAVPDILEGLWDIFFVRGPLSAEALKLSEKYWITDSAVLLKLLPWPAVKILQDKISFMPHRRSAECGNWKDLCDQAGLNYIDPRWSVDKCIREIRASSMLITEAMHGAIVADIFRIPWVSVKFYSHFLDFKWRDWTSSLSMPFRPLILPPLWTEKYFDDIEKWHYGWENSYYMNCKFKLIKFFGKKKAQVTSKRRVDQICNALTSIDKEKCMLSDEKVLDEAVDKMEEQLFLFRKRYNH